VIGDRGFCGGIEPGADAIWAVADRHG